MIFEELYQSLLPISLHQKSDQFIHSSEEVMTFTDHHIERRFGVYARKSKELKKKLSFQTIDWPKSTYLEVKYREVSFIPQGEGCQIEVSGLLTSTPKELALIPDAEILEIIEDVILVTEAEPFFEPGPRVIYVNKAFEKCTGYSLKDIFGNTPKILQGPNTSAEGRKKIRDALVDWRPITVELLNYTKAQKEFMIELKISPKKDEAGWFTHWVSIQRDISQRILLEHQLSHNTKFAHIGELASGIGHEINNPAAIIRGLLEMNEELYQELNFTEEKVRKNYERMKLAVDRIIQITRGLRSYSRTDSEPNGTFSVNELIRETVFILTPIYSKEGIQLHATICEDDVVVTGQRIRLQQVLLNLIGNAKDACSSVNSPRIEITLKKRIGFGFLEIGDNGQGIPAEHQARIFDPFFTTKSKGHGTGIGLSIVKNIIEDLEGSIKLRSTVGEGTTFQVTLPVSISVPLSPSPEKQQIELKAAPGLRALVVEDEPDLLEVFVAQLKKFNVEAIPCADSAEALEALQKEKFDIIFSDYTMPVMDGGMLFRKVRDLKLVPEPKFVIVSGGNLQRSDRAKDIINELSAHMEKPFTRKDLGAVLKKFFPDKF